MSDGELTAEQITLITATVDIEAPPPHEPTAHLIFGTNQAIPATAIRCEDRSANTWQNVEFALPHLREAIASGLPLTAVSKWYHLRAIHVLRTHLPELDPFHAISWEPVYSGAAITRQNWTDTDERRQKVIRDRDEVARKVNDGTYRPAKLVDGAWR